MKVKIIIVVALALITTDCYPQRKAVNAIANTSGYQISKIHMQSRWAKEVTPENALIEYPRPQLQRKNWVNLNGLWQYAITDSSLVTPQSFTGNILVPYPVESALSGVQKRLMPNEILWYKKTIPYPSHTADERIILNFGAVDWKATIIINGETVGQHKGGYQNFSLDITNFLKQGDNELLVKVYDPTDQGPNPHGKQVLNPSNIYYTPSSGIWQTVWLEKVPTTHISQIKSTPDIDNAILNLKVLTEGNDVNMAIRVEAKANGKTVGVIQKRIDASQNEHELETIFALNIANMKLWSPDDPFLYDLSVKILRGKKTIDEVSSYFGMRKIDIQKDEKGSDRIFLNNKYTYNLGTLDQGFWPEGLYTAPTDEALKFDIKFIKSLGFNTIRKHIKIEPERWYYHADKIGVLVWQDFVNPPFDLPDGSRTIFENEVKETMNQLYNHPSIITWVVFNERWGAYDQERLTEWVKKNDPSRIVNGHSGELLYVNNQLRAPSENPWVSSDITDIHSYPEPMNPPGLHNKARVVGEFGGIGVPVPDHEWDDTQGWGYIQSSAAELKEKYLKMTKELKTLEQAGLSASIYTQPVDVEGEENGLLTYDRDIIKIPVNEIRDINKIIINQTKGFELDPNFYIAKNIDTSDNDNRYQEFLTKYNNGFRDSAFLRRLTLMAFRLKDQKNITTAGNSYIDILSQPFSYSNLSFILKITRTSSDRGFKMCWEYPQKIDTVMGQYTAITKIRKVIDAEEIAPTYKNHPDWDAIQQRAANKYGDLGETYILGRRMIYYGFESNDWANYGKYYIQYFKKALTTSSEYAINNVTWVLYQHVTDPKVLEFAATVMKYAIDNNLDRSPEAYDTYANLLHRTNNSVEAIKWEEKALAQKKGAPDEKVYAETLQKMKAGQPTWPQNN